MGAAEAAGLKEWDYVWSINGQEVFEMSHNQICSLIKSAGTSLEMVVDRGDQAQQQGQERQVQAQVDRHGILHGRHGEPWSEGPPPPARELHHLRQAGH